MISYLAYCVVSCAGMGLRLYAMRGPIRIACGMRMRPTPIDLLELAVIQRGIGALFRQELLVVALLDNIALLHEQDGVRIADG